MRYSCGIQISDLEAIQSGFKQKLTSEEAEKVVGGINSHPPALPKPPSPPSPPFKPQPQGPEPCIIIPDVPKWPCIAAS